MSMYVSSLSHDKSDWSNSYSPCGLNREFIISKIPSTTQIMKYLRNFQRKQEKPIKDMKKRWASKEFDTVAEQLFCRGPDRCLPAPQATGVAQGADLRQKNLPQSTAADLFYSSPSSPQHVKQ